MVTKRGFFKNVIFLWSSSAQAQVYGLALSEATAFKHYATKSKYPMKARDSLYQLPCNDIMSTIGIPKKV